LLSGRVGWIRLARVWISNGEGALGNEDTEGKEGSGEGGGG
jgi:hypothetical protein